MIVLNAGVPRSGTVLVNAIIRELYKLAGREIRLANPLQSELPELIADLQRTGADETEIVLIHTHTWDAETARLLRGSRHVTGTINFRDPRDVCVSLMRLHDHEVEQAAQTVEAYFDFVSATVACVNLMVIPYELLAAEKRAHIFQIAGRLRIWPSMRVIERVDSVTSIERHKRIMEKVRAGDVPGLAIRQNSKRQMSEDTESLINDRHIQSGASGRWRNELPPDVQKALTARFAPILKRFGYPE